MGEVEVVGLGEGKGASVEGELSEEGSRGGESGEDGSEDEEGSGEQKGKGGWEKQGKRGRARRRAKRRKQTYSDIGEDGMSRSHSSSGERRARRVKTLSPSPRRLHGGGTGERNESAGGPGFTGGQQSHSFRTSVKGVGKRLKGLNFISGVKHRDPATVGSRWERWLNSFELFADGKDCLLMVIPRVLSSRGVVLCYVTMLALMCRTFLRHLVTLAMLKIIRREWMLWINILFPKRTFLWQDIYFVKPNRNQVKLFNNL